MSEIQLTKTEQFYMDLITQYVKQNGYPPSIRELADISKKSVWNARIYIDRLQEKGALVKSQDSTQRTICLPKSTGKVNTNNIFLPVYSKLSLDAPHTKDCEILTYLSVPEDVATPKSFFIKMTGNAMIDKGIEDGDFLLVNPCNHAKTGDIVLALVGKTFLVRGYKRANKKYFLFPFNSSMMPMILEQVTLIGKILGVYRFMTETDLEES